LGDKQCTHAIADTVEGPYQKVDVALQVWAHSCRAFRDKVSGDWLLFHVGTGISGNGGGPRNCTRNALNPPLLPEPPALSDTRLTSGWLHNASSPNGPWKPVTAIGWTFPNSTDPGAHLISATCGDAAPFQHQDGSWSMVCDTFPDDFYIATAPHYAGPWTIHHSLSGCDEASTTAHPPGFHCNASWPNAKTPTNPSGSMMEDPFHWIDRRGNWHVLAHQYISLSPHSFEDPVSGHAFSPDGFNWTWSTAQPFNGSVCEALHKPGSSFTSPCGSRERPFLLFDDLMQPTHLLSAINSVCQGGNKDGTGKDWVYTAVQPIRAPSLKNDDGIRGSPLKSTLSSMPTPAIAELDCAMRKLAYEYGAEILAAAHSSSTARLQQLKAALLWPSSMVTQYCNESEFVLNLTKEAPASGGTLGAEQPQTGVAIFVSDDSGSDTAAGTLAAPFKTLQRAQQQVRSIIAKGLGRLPIIVNVRAGTYQENQTLTFGPQDGGTVDAPVIWTAYQHETVVISGGLRLNNLQWKPVGAASGLGRQVMQASLPAQVSVPAENWTSLFIGAKRAIWARWPNGDPSADSGLCLRRAAGQIDPHTGNLSKNSHPSAQQWDPKFPNWSPHCTDPIRSMPNTVGRMGWATAGAGPFTEWQWPTNATSVKGTPTGGKSRSGPTYSGFNSCTGGAAARYMPPFNTWCCGGGSNVRTGLGTAPRKLLPSGKYFQELGTPGMNWTHTDRAVVQMFHPLLWGWWAFSVEHASPATGLVNFSAGGWQEARGGGIGEHFYIENLLEELDYEREWHARDSTLSYMPAAEESVDSDGRLGINDKTTATKGWTEQTVTVPVLETVIRVQGTMAKPVQHLQFRGLTIAHSTTTYMEPYEVPSGG
jgi:hypothetical protein